MERKGTERKWHVQDNAAVEIKDVKVYCHTNQFPELSFSGSHSKPRGARGLSKHYHEHSTFFLSLFFPWIVFNFSWSMAPFWRCSFSRRFLNSWAKLTSLFSGASVNFNLWIKYYWSRKLNLGNQLIYITIINSIKYINHFFTMPRCTYTSINNDGVTLWHHWKKL